MAAPVVPDRGTDVVRDHRDPAEELVDALPEELGVFVQGGVEIRDIRLMVLAVVDLHRLHIDVRFERRDVVGELGEHVSRFCARRGRFLLLHLCHCLHS